MGARMRAPISPPPLNSSCGIITGKVVANKAATKLVVKSGDPA
jgi:hypothetical protein